MRWRMYCLMGTSAVIMTPWTAETVARARRGLRVAATTRAAKGEMG